MGQTINELAKRIFGSDPTESNRKIEESWITHLDNREAKARKAAVRLQAYYNKNRVAILEYVRTVANLTFDSTSDWHMPPLNPTQRIIKRVSMAYKQLPIRVLADDNGKE